VDVPDEAEPMREERVLLSAGDYILTGANSYQGGSLTLGEALGVGQDIIVERWTNPLQPISIRNQGNNFRPEVHEDVFDRLTMMVQDRDRTTVDNASSIQWLRDAVLSLESRASALEARVTTLEHTQHVVVIPTSGDSGDALVFGDASAGPVTVDLPAANDPLARPTVIIKTDDTENQVSIVPAAGTISTSEGRSASCELTIQDEPIRVVPNPALNHWFRA
jgi:hypothetical protein